MYSPVRHIDSVFYKRKPIHLTFFVTRRCNSMCPFCFYLRSNTSIPPLSKGDGNKESSASELSLDEITKISSSLKSLLWLAFSGGEIYLRDDLIEISRVFYKNNKPAIMLYPTNGLLPEIIRDRTENILKHCEKSVIAVKLSIDGMYEEHDELRNTPGSFKKTMQTYHLLGELTARYPNFELGINTVFCAKNQDSMDKIIDFIMGLPKIKTHTISLVRGDLHDESFQKIDIHKYYQAVERLENNLRNRVSGIYRFRGARLKAAQDILQRRLIYRTMLRQKRLIPCYAGRLNLVLTENGDVYPCEILTESFGNIRDYYYNMGSVIRSGKAKRIISSITDKQCYCTHECYFMTNILFNPFLYPSLLKEYLQI